MIATTFPFDPNPNAAGRIDAHICIALVHHLSRGRAIAKGREQTPQITAHPPPPSKKRWRTPRTTLPTPRRPRAPWREASRPTSLSRPRRQWELTPRMQRRRRRRRMRRRRTLAAMRRLRRRSLPTGALPPTARGRRCRLRRAPSARPKTPGSATAPACLRPPRRCATKVSAICVFCVRFAHNAHPNGKLQTNPHGAHTHTHPHPTN